VSQPFDRGAYIASPGPVDEKLGEFWTTSPWRIAAEGHNLSCYERKRVYWNVPGAEGGRDFLDISFLTGGDSDGDGRSIVAGDFRNIGRLDLVLRQVGGGSVILYENNFPQRHYLKVSLRGKVTPGKIPTSNRQGIGARLTAVVNGQPLVREMFPVNTFHSQMPNLVHFGLADSDKVDKLIIRWPSGLEQVLTNVAGDRHIVVDEGSDAIETVTPGKTIRP
jgi:hypothetical protein